jgi:hypothetical protein
MRCRVLLTHATPSRRARSWTMPFFFPSSCCSSGLPKTRAMLSGTCPTAASLDKLARADDGHVIYTCLPALACLPASLCVYLRSHACYMTLAGSLACVRPYKASRNRSSNFPQRCLAGGYLMAGGFLFVNVTLALATGWDQMYVKFLPIFVWDTPVSPSHRALAQITVTA